MTLPSSSVRVVGMVWYRREDYKAIKAIMVDSEELPDTYDKWRYQVEKTVKQLKRHGLMVERVYIDPQEFPDWCRAKGMQLNGAARSAFASEGGRPEAVRRRSGA
ncbi:MAG TPA: hypothetical protein VJ822_07635 [Dongiaceae bacterium]|nr:hypothetical protein [Dongiaceae bacterium]